jgi:hypothetical protein
MTRGGAIKHENTSCFVLRASCFVLRVFAPRCTCVLAQVWCLRVQCGYIQSSRGDVLTTWT